MSNKNQTFEKAVSLGTSILLAGAAYAWKPAMIVGGATLLKACSDSSTNTQPEEPEEPVEQDEFYQNWTEAGIDIDFIKGAGVSGAQMEAAIANVKNAYSTGLTAGQRTSFGTKIEDIKVKATNGMSKNGTVLTIGHNETLIDLANYMEKIADGLIVKAKKVKEDINAIMSAKLKNYKALENAMKENQA